ncbi:uncharacterized protein [Physeter macrocephalus]|uniref:Uncharacterized protein n=1 Tax=Physeter macrocephalus TaxID=9755 RepID=A0A9W2X6S2_PHYMC|nr:uncharacterized protein LOC129392835 [Physeter catodon]
MRAEMIRAISRSVPLPKQLAHSSTLQFSPSGWRPEQPNSAATSFFLFGKPALKEEVIKLIHTEVRPAFQSQRENRSSWTEEAESAGEDSAGYHPDFFQNLTTAQNLESETWRPWASYHKDALLSRSRAQAQILLAFCDAIGNCRKGSGVGRDRWEGGTPLEGMFGADVSYVLKLWYLDQQHQQHPVTCSWCNFQPRPHLRNQRL